MMHLVFGVQQEKKKRKEALVKNGSFLKVKSIPLTKKSIASRN